MGLWDYNTIKYLQIRSVKLVSLKWSIHGIILAAICVMLFSGKKYQEHDYLVSSVTAKVKGVAVTKDSELGRVLWDVTDHSGSSQGKDSFFVVTNAVVTKNQTQGNCEEGPDSGTICSSNEDCTKEYTNQKSNGVQTGTCVESVKTCEVFAWCPIEERRGAPKPAILESAENFTVFIKNSIGFINFNYTKRNILPDINDTYLRWCIFNRKTDPYCPKFRLGDIVQEAGENFIEMAVEGGVIAIQINWECDLDWLLHKCVPEYSFRRLDEKNDKKTLFPGLNFRFARYFKQNGVEERTLFKVYGIRFDVMVTGKAGRFDLIKLITYIGSTLAYFGVTIIVVDFLLANYIHPSCCKKEVKSYYTGKKYEAVEDQTESPLCISFVDEDHIEVVKGPVKKSLQEMKPASPQVRRLHNESMRECLSFLQRPPSHSEDIEMQEERQTGATSKEHETPPWCRCGQCHPMTSLKEELCCRRSAGQCISTSATFSRLVLDRQTLESVLLYRNPLLDLQAQASTKWLRHCAYHQYTQWRFGDVETDSCAVIPSCSVWKIRERYPSVEGQYTGLCCEKRCLYNMIKVISETGEE
ncbi:P2X purinoceptor 4-like [Huso huso]|uniref:P2X purinoceptor n=1 Tax=Huso huso TaxID=61971 RepID=A0ABR0Y0F7_HUSHU